MRAGSNGNVAGGQTIDAITQHLLEVSLEQIWLNREIMQSLQLINQELASWCGVTVAAVSLPGPIREAQQILPKVSADSNVEAYLVTFEHTMQRKDWDPRDWSHLSAPLIEEAAQHVYYALPTTEATDYGLLSAKILACRGLSVNRTSATFHRWSYWCKREPQAQTDDLVHATNRWLQPHQLTQDTVLHLAQTHPLRGQQGPRYTLEKVQDSFHWQGMVTDM